MSPEKKGSTTRASSGDHTHCAKPIMATSREIDTTSFVASLVPSSPRKMTRSSRIPNAGASTSSTRTTAIGVGHPQPTAICQ